MSEETFKALQKTIDERKRRAAEARENVPEKREGPIEKTTPVRGPTEILPPTEKVRKTRPRKTPPPLMRDDDSDDDDVEAAMATAYKARVPEVRASELRDLTGRLEAVEKAIERKAPPTLEEFREVLDLAAGKKLRLNAQFVERAFRMLFGGL